MPRPRQILCAIKCKKLSETGCVEVMEALRNAFLGTASQRHLAKQPITPAEATQARR
jgi:hypothetical protein